MIQLKPNCKKSRKHLRPIYDTSVTQIIGLATLNIKSMQKVWRFSAETCLVPFFQIGVPTLPLLPPSKWTLSKVNNLTYPMCKKPTCDTSQKDSERYNWVIFFWLVENHINSSYPKGNKIVTGSEVGKFGEVDEKCCIRKCNQCVTNVRPIYGPSTTYHVLHLRLLCTSVSPTCN